MWYWGLFTKQTRIGVTVAGVFWCLCLLAGQGDQQRDETVAQPTRTVAPTPMITATPETQVSWNEIDSIYSLNSRNTDLQKKEEWKRFKGKKVTWNGTVASVNDGLLGTTLQVKMNADTFTSDALVSLKRSEHAKAARLHEGDRVTFSGRLVDWGTLLPVSLDQGEIIE